jgi:hypothetical protein
MTTITHTTYNVELLTSHPRTAAGETYDTTFHGGQIWKQFATWAEALAAAEHMLAKNDACTVVYVTERQREQPGSTAKPLVRWQCVRSRLDGVIVRGAMSEVRQ